MSATITLVNPDNIPGSNRMIFNTIQTPDSTVPNVVHNTQALEIEDTGTAPLVISSMTINGPWQFVNPAQRELRRRHCEPRHPAGRHAEVHAVVAPRSLLQRDRLHQQSKWGRGHQPAG